MELEASPLVIKDGIGSGGQLVIKAEDRMGELNQEVLSIIEQNKIDFPENSDVYTLKGLAKDIISLCQSEVLAALDSIDEANFPEPCEPECSPIRHAEHMGSWNHHIRIKSKIAELKSRYGRSE